MRRQSFFSQAFKDQTMKRETEQRSVSAGNGRKTRQHPFYKRVLSLLLCMSLAGSNLSPALAEELTLDFGGEDNNITLQMDSDEVSKLQNQENDGLYVEKSSPESEMQSEGPEAHTLYAETESERITERDAVPSGGAETEPAADDQDEPEKDQLIADETEADPDFFDETEPDTELMAEDTEAVLYEAGVLFFEGKDYTVSLTYGSNAEIPAGARLKVTEIRRRREVNSYKEEAAQALELDSSEDIRKARFFDITIIDSEGLEIQPAAEVNVNIELRDAVVDNTSVDVLHFHDEEDRTTEILTDVNVDNFSAAPVTDYADCGSDTASGWSWVHRHTALNEIQHPCALDLLNERG